MTYAYVTKSWHSFTDISFMSKCLVMAFLAMSFTNSPQSFAQNTISRNMTMMQTPSYTNDWDKTYPKDQSVYHEKVTFPTRFGTVLVADLFRPKEVKEPLAAIAISGPFGAVKEQSSGLYAQRLARRGFLAIAFDPSFTGESSGEPRYVASPDINTEDMQAAVDFLSNHALVNPKKVGILGICGWGGLAINTAAIDPRIRATVAVTMYDMSRVTANGYFDQDNSPEKRNELRFTLAQQRNLDYQNQTYARAGGVIDPLPDNVPDFVKDYYDYYKTKRGYHPRSLNSNAGWNVTGLTSYLNTPLLTYAGEIDRAVLLVHGDKAHSRYFSDSTFNLLRGDNKQYIIVPNTNHTDLYDKKDHIPFDAIESFYREYLVD